MPHVSTRLEARGFGLGERRFDEERLQDLVYMLVSLEFSQFRTVYLRHPHRKAFNDDMGIEGLEDILRDQTVVDALVLVLFELRELVLPYIYHFYFLCRVQVMEKCTKARECLCCGGVDA
jgi:hypothetical protein